MVVSSDLRIATAFRLVPCTITVVDWTIVIPLFAILRKVVTMSTRFLGTFM